MTLASGAKLAVVCQDGAAATAGSVPTWLPINPMTAHATTVDSAVALIFRTERNANSLPPRRPFE